MDHYEVLGCGKESTREEIKRAYHARLLQLHPDKRRGAAPEDDARGEFHRVREAWRVLGHSRSRKEYDATCKQEELEEYDGGDGLVYARLSPDELEETICEDTLAFRCRCGGRYHVEREDLHEDAALQVTCDSCTLVIIVEM